MPDFFPRLPDEPELQASIQPASFVPETIETVDASALDNGKVCRSQRRPGSRIAETICFTAQEYAANQALRDEQVKAYIDALDQDQRNREIAQQQMEQDRRRGITQMR